jgi:hypothetical protein
MAYSIFRANVPQVYFNLDRDKAKTLDVDVGEVVQTLQAYLGSLYVNDILGPMSLNRVNMCRAASVTAVSAPGYPTGSAIAGMLATTTIRLILVPVLYVAIQAVRKWTMRQYKGIHAPLAQVPDAQPAAAGHYAPN